MLLKSLVIFVIDASKSMKPHYQKINEELIIWKNNILNKSIDIIIIISNSLATTIKLNTSKETSNNFVIYEEEIGANDDLSAGLKIAKKEKINWLENNKNNENNIFIVFITDTKNQKGTEINPQLPMLCFKIKKNNLKKDLIYLTKQIVKNKYKSEKKNEEKNEKKNEAKNEEKNEKKNEAKNEEKKFIFTTFFTSLFQIKYLRFIIFISIPISIISIYLFINIDIDVNITNVKKDIKQEQDSLNRKIKEYSTDVNIDISISFIDSKSDNCNNCKGLLFSYTIEDSIPDYKLGAYQIADTNLVTPISISALYLKNKIAKLNELYNFRGAIVIKIHGEADANPIGGNGIEYTNEYSNINGQLYIDKNYDTYQSIYKTDMNNNLPHLRYITTNTELAFMRAYAFGSFFKNEVDLFAINPPQIQ